MYQTPRKFTWNLHYDVDNTLDVTHAKFEKSKFRNGWEIWIWSAEDTIGITKKRDVCGKGGAAGSDTVLRGHQKNSSRYAHVPKTVRET